MKREDFENLPIGSKFTLGSKILEVKKSKGCNKCFFRNLDLDCDELYEIGLIPKCYYQRNDEKSVVFIEVIR